MPERYDFSYEVLDIIVSGKSAIDSDRGFQIRSVDEAERFVRSYGFNLENPIERAEATGNFHEALNFVRRYFLQPENPDGLKLEIPRKILELTDLRELFLMASLSYAGQSSDTQGIYLKNWACAILKIMHTVAHVDQDIRSPYFSDIQKQIFDRFYKVVHRDMRDGVEQLYLGEKPEDRSRVNLVAFETKPKKSRDSILLKLLHKPENVAEDIFDRVGIRFITRTKLDALRVVKFLKDRLIVMPPNIKPSRSRNTLIHIEEFKQALKTYVPQFETGEIDEETLKARLEAVGATRTASDDRNVYSSDEYRAIQFTGRQLIKLRSPLHADIKELKTKAKTAALPADIASIVDRIDVKYVPKEIRFFYPYEVQIVDLSSAQENERGMSAHSEYKKAQLQAALKRVMGPLFDASKHA